MVAILLIHIIRVLSELPTNFLDAKHKLILRILACHHDLGKAISSGLKANMRSCKFLTIQLMIMLKIVREKSSILFLITTKLSLNFLNLYERNAIN
jgi:hypothetical protein